MKAADILMWNSVSILGYGYLYNWYTASDSNFAPTDWKVPEDSDYSELITYINNTYGVNKVGAKLKESGLEHWNTPNTDADNDTGFTAFGGGFRNNTGTYTSLLNNATFYASDQYSSTDGQYLILYYNSASYATPNFSKKLGLSIRLLYTGTGSPTTVTDYDGNVYDVVQIGTQYWTVQNWKCTHYNDGGAIPNITDNTQWASGWGNVEDGYGFLYNHYAVSDANFGMTDWGIPSESEFSTFYSYLGSTYGSNSGGALKSTDSAYWNSPNTGATNSEGFFGIGSGYRRSGLGDFAYRKQVGFWWLSNQKVVGYYYNSSSLEIPLGVNADSGNAVRLIYKGTGTPSSTVTDIDGNVYNTVLIGTQYWLVQDFRCTKLKDGTDIPNVRPHSEWVNMTTKAYCIYDNQTRGSRCAYDNDENNV